MASDDVSGDGEAAGSVDVWRMRAEAWKAQAEYWRAMADRLEAEIGAMTAPALIRFRGFEGDRFWERDVMKMPAEDRDEAIAFRPALATWNSVEVGRLLLLLCPYDVSTTIPAEHEVLRNH